MQKVNRKYKRLMLGLFSVPFVIAGSVASSIGKIGVDHNTEVDYRESSNESCELNGDLTDFEMVSETASPTLSPYEKYKEELANFKSELTPNLAGITEINETFITYDNIGKYIDVFEGHIHGVVNYGNATVRINALRPVSGSLFIVFTFSAYGFEEVHSASVTGFLDYYYYVNKDLREYADKWNVHIYNDNIEKLSKMFSSQIYNAELFNQYFTMQIDYDYSVRVVNGSFYWPNLQTLEVTVEFNRRKYDPKVIPVRKVIRYSGFHRPEAEYFTHSPFTPKNIQYDYPLFYLNRIDWADYWGGVPNFESERTKNYMEQALVNAARKAMDDGVLKAWKNVLNDNYGAGDTWNIDVKLFDGWYQQLQFYVRHTHLWGSAFKYNYSVFPQNNVAYIGLWKPPFVLTITNPRIPGFKITHHFWLKRS